MDPGGVSANGGRGRVERKEMRWEEYSGSNLGAGEGAATGRQRGVNGTAAAVALVGGRGCEMSERER